MNIYLSGLSFLNERIVGFTNDPQKLARRMRLLRRNSVINICTSIVVDYSRMTLKFNTTAGRCTRPLLIVNPAYFEICNEEMSAINSHSGKFLHIISQNVTDEVSWNELIYGRISLK